MQAIGYLLTALVLLSSCQTKEQDLQSEITVQEIFNTSEVNDLNKILTFFESQICAERAKLKDSKECYSDFFSTLLNSVEVGEIAINIDFEKQRMMYEELEDSTFSTIWVFSKTLKYGSQDTLQSISYLHNGKFAKLLERTAEDYPIIAGYSETFKVVGDISPSVTATLVMEHSKLNLDDPRIKLIVAIHYLTLNDQYLRNAQY